MNENLLGIILVLSEEHFFSARLPSRFTIKKFTSYEDKKYIIQGLIEANILSLIATFFIYFYSKSQTALLISLTFLGILNILYLNDMEIIKLY